MSGKVVQLPATRRKIRILQVLAGTDDAPRTCKTCAHRNGGMSYGICMLSGCYIETERKYPARCGVNFERWVPRPSLLQRLRAAFRGTAPGGALGDDDAAVP